MKITLVSANYDAGKYRKGENLGIKALEAIARLYGHDVYIYDSNSYHINDAELINLIKNNGSKIVGFSVSFTHQIYETIRLAKVMRDKLVDVHFTIGGQGVSFIIQKILADNSIFDSGICFEGEFTFLELVQCLEENKSIVNIKGLYYRIQEKINFNGYRNPIEDLDQLPFMNRDISFKEVELKHISMITSRGCVGKCLFCSSGYFSNRYHNSKKWRYRSAENIIQEIESINDDIEGLAISFVDDNFLGGTVDGYERAKKFSKMILNKELKIRWAIECRVDDVEFMLFELMKQAGLVNVFLGIESGNEADLKLFNKNITLNQIDTAIKVLEKLKIIYNIGFIMFHPTSTVDQLIENAFFLKKYKNANSKNLLNELSLYHGSPLVKYYTSKGLVRYDKYSILYKYEDKKIELILSFAKRLLNQFGDIETKLNRFLFKMQNVNIDLSDNNHFNQYLKIKKELSDFEANIFIDLCEKIDDINLWFVKSENKVNHFKVKIDAETMQLLEE